MYLPEGLEDTPLRQFLDKFWTFFLQVWTILDDLKQFWIKFAKRKIKRNHLMDKQINVLYIYNKPWRFKSS